MHTEQGRQDAAGPELPPRCRPPCGSRHVLAWGSRSNTIGGRSAALLLPPCLLAHSPESIATKTESGSESSTSRDTSNTVPPTRSLTKPAGTASSMPLYTSMGCATDWVRVDRVKKKVCDDGRVAKRKNEIGQDFSADA